MMKPTILAACAATLALAACAKNPDSIAPVSLGNAYQSLDCETAANELRTSIANLENLSATQRAAVAGDAVAVLLIGVPTSSLVGNNKEGAIAAEKGKIEALRARLASCSSK